MAQYWLAGRRTCRPSSSGVSTIGLGRDRGEVQHVALVGHRGWQAIGPGHIKHHMAGGTGERAAAVGLNALDASVYRGFHEALAGLGLDVLGGLVGGDESDVDHVG